MNNKSNNPMEELLASLSKKSLQLTRGQEVEGKIISKSDKEIILDLGVKAEGVIATKGINPAQLEKLKIGDNFKAIVAEIENENGQVVLTLEYTVRSVAPQSAGISQTQWDQVVKKYQKDNTVKGTVTKITQFGVFVKLEEGIEGLIHVSKLGPDSQFQEGQVLSVSIDEIDNDKKRIALSPVITSTKGLIYK